MSFAKFTIKRQKKDKKRRPFFKYIVALFVLLSLATVLYGSKLFISYYSLGKTFDNIEQLPAKKTALLLGCSKKLSNGCWNLYYQRRINAAAKLYHSGKIKFIIASGDNGNMGYNEPQAMKQSLTTLGVPANAIYCDYAGFRTLDSVIRAHKIFGQNDLVIISQKFHNERAIFLAHQNGIKAIGFNAEDISFSYGFLTKCRELAACTKALLDIYILKTKPRFLGERIHLGSASQPTTL